MNIETIVVEWADVKKAYLAGVEDGKFLTGQPIASKQRRWHKQPTKGDDWEGGSPLDTCENLRNGYRAEQFAHSAEYAAMAERSHFTYHEEEGELDPDLVIGGYDKVYLNRELRESKPGLRLMFEFAFSCATSSRAISEYGAWCASLLTSLESSGYDLVVDMFIPLDSLFVGNSSKQLRSHVLVRVKNENEKSNFTSWSALFGPTGYRHLGFLAKCIAGKQIGKTVTESFGMTLGGKDWGVTYDREMAAVTVHVNQRAGDKFLPVDRLNEDAMKENLIPRPILIAGLNDK